MLKNHKLRKLISKRPTKIKGKMIFHHLVIMNKSITSGAMMRYLETCLHFNSCLNTLDSKIYSSKTIIIIQ